MAKKVKLKHPPQFIHLNGNVLCVISGITTGPVVGFHDLIDLFVMIVDTTLNPWLDIFPFHAYIRPENMENYIDQLELAGNLKKKVLYCASKGVSAQTAAEVFDQWFDSLNLARAKRIYPLAYNWPDLNHFVRDWLGPVNYEHKIDYRYRDVLAAAGFQNDRADFMVRNYAFAKQNLSYLAATCKIEYVPRQYCALQDAVTILKIYQQQVVGF